MLSVKSVDFGYNNSKTLSDISFTVQAGEYLAVVGESGSGKSTLLKLIYGEFDVNNGSISWNSTPILGPKDKLVVGYDFMKYVAQEFDLMPFTTVGENIGTHLSNFFPIEKTDTGWHQKILIFVFARVTFFSGACKISINGQFLALYAIIK